MPLASQKVRVSSGLPRLIHTVRHPVSWPARSGRSSDRLKTHSEHRGPKVKMSKCSAAEVAFQRMKPTIEADTANIVQRFLAMYFNAEGKGNSVLRR